MALQWDTGAGPGGDMDSDLLTPFVELEEDFCSTRGPGSCVTSQLRPAGLQRRHSHCPITLPKFRMNSSEAPGPPGPTLVEQRWSRELACSALSHIPFRMDRSVSMIEGPTLPPPPGLTPSALAPRIVALSSLTPSDLSPELLAPELLAPELLVPDLLVRLPSSPLLSPRYKTELCRTFQESGACKYGAKCQFAHGPQELRGLSRHPKYKTEPCRTFHTIGFCPYGARCHFIHNADELCSGARRPGASALRHSISFSGVSLGATPQLSRACSMSPPPLSTEGSPDSLYTSPLLPEPGALKHFSYPLSSLLDTGDDLALHFSAVPEQEPGALWRCSSQDSVSECVSEEGYVSSGSRSQSPCDPPRLPIFSQMSTETSTDSD